MVNDGSTDSFTTHDGPSRDSGVDDEQPENSGVDDDEASDSTEGDEEPTATKHEWFQQADQDGHEQAQAGDPRDHHINNITQFDMGVLSTCKT